VKNPWLEVEVHSLPIPDWLKRELPSWATRTRFHARTVAHEDTIVLAATCAFGDVGYAIFDKHLSHLHYIETREDCPGQGSGGAAMGEDSADADSAGNHCTGRH
jgi:hypothetical protein